MFLDSLLTYVLYIRIYWADNVLCIFSYKKGFTKTMEPFVFPRGQGSMFIIMASGYPKFAYVSKYCTAMFLPPLDNMGEETISQETMDALEKAFEEQLNMEVDGGNSEED